jgi:hypothetical protein
MMKKLLILFVISLCFIFSCETTETPEEQKSSLKCIEENGPAFYLNSAGQCEWAHALTLPTGGDSYWKTRITGSSFGIDAFLLIHREKGEIKGWGKCYAPDAAHNGWATSTPYPGSCIVGVFQWDLAPTNAKTLLISQQFNCTISMISNVTPNAGDYPSSFTATITSAAGSKTHTFTLVSGSSPF